ncbi:unnamed protein product [Closterium sp. NIES-54]
MSSGMDGTVANNGTAAEAGSASPAIDAVRNTTALMCPSMNHGTTCASNYVVYSSEASAYLADLIAQQLSVERGTVIRKQFKGGEKYLRVLMDEKYQLVGQDVIYVAATHTDDDLLELVRLGCAFAAYGSRRRIFVIPFLGYSTMERQVLPGEVITSKVNARILSSIPNSKLGNIFLFMDLHVQSLLQYLEGPCVSIRGPCLSVLLFVLVPYSPLGMAYRIPNSKLGNIFLFMDLHVQSLLQYLEGPCLRARVCCSFQCHCHTVPFSWKVLPLSLLAAARGNIFAYTQSWTSTCSRCGRKDHV